MNEGKGNWREGRRKWEVRRGIITVEVEEWTSALGYVDSVCNEHHSVKPTQKEQNQCNFSFNSPLLLLCCSFASFNCVISISNSIHSSLCVNSPLMWFFTVWITPSRLCFSSSSFFRAWESLSPATRARFSYIIKEDSWKDLCIKIRSLDPISIHLFINPSFRHVVGEALRLPSLLCVLLYSQPLHYQSDMRRYPILSILSRRQWMSSVVFCISRWRLSRIILSFLQWR